jgi:hypothetical protein
MTTQQPPPTEGQYPGYYPPPSGGHYPGYYPPPPGYYQPPQEKRKVWPWVLLGVVILLLGGCFASFVALVGSSVDSSPSATTSARHTPPTPDERYLYILKSNVAGITNTDGDAGLIRGGHAVCDALQAGRSRDSIRRQFHPGAGVVG